MSGKGDGRRPTEIDEDKMKDNWESIFGKTKRCDVCRSGTTNKIKNAKKDD